MPPTDPATNRTLSILIPTHNRADQLAHVLDCIARLNRPDGWAVEVVVVANNCTDRTVEVAREALQTLWCAGVVVEETTPGVNAARNRALVECTGELCVLLDDDVSFEPHWAVEVVDFFHRHPADLAGGKVKLWWDAVDRPPWFDARLDSLLSENDLGREPLEVESHVGTVGANLWFRRRVWERIGDFRLDLDRCGDSTLGGGDSDFVERALRNGFRAFYSPNGAVRHWVAPGRTRPGYLLGVSYGNARGRVRMKPPLSLPKWFRCATGHAYLWIRHGVASMCSRALKGRDAALPASVESQAGLGGLRGLQDRWRSERAPRSPNDASVA